MSGFHDNDPPILFKTRQMRVTGDDVIRPGFYRSFENVVIGIVGQDYDFVFRFNDLSGEGRQW